MDYFVSPTTSSSPESGSTSRRTLVKGIAWSTPIVVTASPTPAIAASPQISLTMGTYSGWNKTAYRLFNRCTSGSNLVWDGRAQNSDVRLGAPSTNSASIYLRDADSTTQVTAVTVSVWVPVPNLTWVVYGGQPWTAPTRTGSTTVYSGRTYYEYRSTYTGTTPVPYRTGYSGWMAIPYGLFYTNECFTSKPNPYLRTGTTATVNGQEMSYITPWAPTS